MAGVTGVAEPRLHQGARSGLGATMTEGIGGIGVSATSLKTICLTGLTVAIELHHPHANVTQSLLLQASRLEPAIGSPCPSSLPRRSASGLPCKRISRAVG
jgi:hypothetical protein